MAAEAKLMRVFRFSIIPTTSASETTSALVRNSCVAFGSVVLSESSLPILVNCMDSFQARSAAVRDSTSFGRNCAKYISYWTPFAFNPTNLCLYLIHILPELLNICALMSQVFLSRLQRFIGLSNLVL